MKKIFYLTSLIILITIFLFISITSYANTVSDDLSDNFFRLHILANSDSNEDQTLKLKVRDKIIEYMNSLSYSNLTKSEAIELTKSNLQNFKEIAQKTILEEGYNYSVNLEIGNFYFPTKENGNISLPAGYYDAIKIEIGEAKGKNWWCSLFPPLCFVDISAGVIDEETEEYLKENLSEDEFSLITDSSEDIKFKFKIVELLNSK